MDQRKKDDWIEVDRDVFVNLSNVADLTFESHPYPIKVFRWGPEVQHIAHVRYLGFAEDQMPARFYDNAAKALREAVSERAAGAVSP